MALSRDIKLLFAARITRLFAYGFLSVVLALYLAEIGLSEEEIGLLFTLTLIGDAGISLWITTSADRIGRKRMLLLGSALMMFAGAVFLMTDNFFLLTFAAIVGVLSPSGNEIGPFLSIEQAALSQLIPDNKRTRTFAWYNLLGSFSTALGALCSGFLAKFLQDFGTTTIATYKILIGSYLLLGMCLVMIFLKLSLSAEVPSSALAPPLSRFMGLHRSKSVVVKLSALAALDSFAGGFIIQSMLAYWFHLKFNADVQLLGSIFFGANILAGISSLLAARIARQFGLINTMVFTHIPSNVLLMLVPLMPTLALAIGVLLLRFSISQMDVPTRQSYIMAVVAPDERSAAAGVTTISRSLGASVSPALSGIFLATPVLLGMPFFLAGGLKIIYDILLYFSFRNLKPPEERT
jgi:MFS family permease